MSSVMFFFTWIKWFNLTPNRNKIVIIVQKHQKHWQNSNLKKLVHMCLAEVQAITTVINLLLYPLNIPSIYSHLKILL